MQRGLNFWLTFWLTRYGYFRIAMHYFSLTIPKSVYPPTVLNVMREDIR